jgi:hypothetical protein
VKDDFWVKTTAGIADSHGFPAGKAANGDRQIRRIRAVASGLSADFSDRAGALELGS